MGRRLIIILLIILLTMFITGCKDEEVKTISSRQLSYTAGWPMRFNYRWFEEDEPVITGAAVRIFREFYYEEFNSTYTELVFVYSEAHAADFPEHVLVAWPGEEVPTILSRLNEAAKRNDLTAEESAFVRRLGRGETVNLEDFGLTYPITIEDAVDNLEKVSDFFNSLTHTERDWVSRYVPIGKDNDPSD